MAKPYLVSITDGTGSGNVVVGEYEVTASVDGYDNASINPSNQTITADVESYDFTIAATGTLILHVTEDGNADGTVVAGATFSRCDANGDEYGDPIVSDDSGNATFSFVPYSTEGNAPNIYYKQVDSDGAHDFDSTLQSITLSEESSTVEITNKPLLNRTLNLTDANYEGLPIATGEITLS